MFGKVFFFDGELSHGKKPQSRLVHTEKNMIVVTGFFLFTNQTEFRLVHNQNGHFLYGRIPFNFKGNEFSPYLLWAKEYDRSNRFLLDYELSGISLGP